MEQKSEKKFKVQIVSDLHREWNPSLFESTVTPEHAKDVVLINAGDFVNGAWFVARKERKEFYAEFEKFADQYKKCIYIFGNHEHYGGKPVKETIELYTIRYPKGDQITFLENDYEYFPEEDVYIFGGTMWTDFSISMYWEKQSIIHSFTDFNSIDNHSLESCELAFKNFSESLEKFIQNVVGPNSRVIVVSHFAPFPDSVHPKYYADENNGYFASNLKLSLKAREKIKLWIHGHTHESFDYIHKQTDSSPGIRVICNPYGYPMENRETVFNPELIVEV